MLNGAAYRPWRDAVVRYALGEDERWANAKQRVATEFFPGVTLSSSINSVEFWRSTWLLLAILA